MFGIFTEEACEQVSKFEAVHASDFGKGETGIGAEGGVGVTVGEIGSVGGFVDPDVKLGVVFVVEAVEGGDGEFAHLFGEGFSDGFVGVGVEVLVGLDASEVVFAVRFFAENFLA